MKKILTLLLALAAAWSLYPQAADKNSAWMNYIEELSDNDSETSSSIENLFEELAYWSEHPVNLNYITKNELDRLPFLSAIQIENILYYIYRHAPLVSIYELKNVEGLDLQSISYLLPFVYVGEPDVKKQFPTPRQIFNHGKNKLLLRYDYCFQEKAGYADATPEEKEKSPNKYYLGEPFYASFKYDFQYKQNIQWGLVGEKDYGEPFWKRQHTGFDYYAFHFVVKDVGALKSLYIGDYRLTFGKGLVMNTDFTLGKSSDIMNAGKTNSGIKRHFSTNENDFFRGIATSWTLWNIYFSVFGSHRKIDANADSATILSIKTDGYNRTVNDWNKRKQATINCAGGNIQWKNETFDIGLTGVYYQFGGKTLDPSPRPYNVFYLRGKENYNLGLHYQYRKKKYSFAGETAIAANGSVATTHFFQIQPASSIGLMLAYRHFPCQYQALFGRTFSEASGVQNESGLYVGVHLKGFRSWEFRGYIDFFRFPWLKYGIDAPSDGKDILLQLNYKPSPSLSSHIRYKFKTKDKNMTENSSRMVEPYSQHRFKYQLDVHPGKAFSLASHFDCNVYNDPALSPVSGWSISQTFGYHPAKSLARFNAGISYFKTTNWNTRIVILEKNAPSNPYFYTYYGNGIRNFGILELELCNKISIFAKVSTTRYFNQETISSGLELIRCYYKTDFCGVIRWKL